MYILIYEIFDGNNNKSVLVPLNASNDEEAKQQSEIVRAIKSEREFGSICHLDLIFVKDNERRKIKL